MVTLHRSPLPLERWPGCQKTATNQFELNACADDRAKQSEARLQKIVDDYMSAHRNDPVARAKMTRALAAFRAYRKAYIEAMFPAADKQREYGSMYPMQHATLWATLTDKAIGDFKRLRAGYAGLLCPNGSC